jgi:hypothetical protein
MENLEELNIIVFWILAMLANYVDLQLIPVINLVIYPLAQSESSTFYQD